MTFLLVHCPPLIGRSAPYCLQVRVFQDQNTNLLLSGKQQASDIDRLLQEKASLQERLMIAEQVGRDANDDAQVTVQ
jgi:flagellar biosynthesis/type III secretory pathway chaperone